MSRFNINKEVGKSSTMPASFYRSKEIFEESKEAIFASCWQYITDASNLKGSGSVYPFTMLEGVLDEPLLFCRDKAGDLRCMSNVCTHRGNIIVQEAGEGKRMLTCGYHGRCFHLDGSFKRMPAFKEVENFPAPADDLTQVQYKKWGPLLFCALNPKMDFATYFKPINERLNWLNFNELVFDAESSRDYPVKANWALYCDNYLEGFHVPFVHPGLNEALVLEDYEYEIFDYCNLQLGVAKEGELVFDIPEGHPDHGQNIYAYYYWMFPNLMMNFYPWGLSLNYIRPIDHENTLVQFRTYRFPDASTGPADNDIHQTELEDEEVVESVQKGVQSRYYKSGRFSATMEKGVHHFHRLLDRFLTA